MTELTYDAQGVVNKRVETLPSGERVVVTPGDLLHGIPKMFEYDVLVSRKEGLERRVAMKYFYIANDAEVRHFTNWWRTAGPDGGKLRLMGYDTETSGLYVLDEKVATIQFGNPMVADPRAYICDVRTLSKGALEEFLTPLEDEEIYLLGQNLKFECLYSIHHLKKRPNRLIDTQVTELVNRAGLFPGGKDSGNDRRAYGMCSMAKLVRRYCGGIDIDKDHDLRVSFYITPPGTHNTRQVIYGGSDVVHPFYIYEEQKKDIDARALRSVLRVEYDLIPILAEMELRGMAFDREGWTALWQEAVAAQDEAEAKLDALFQSCQPDLFSSTGASPKAPARNCDVCMGKGKRAGGRTDCDVCGGTGRIRSGVVRPMYMGGRGKAAKPTPLNWAAPAQVKWAIKQYCSSIAWPFKLVTTESELRKAKVDCGALQWILKNAERVKSKTGVRVEYRLDETLTTNDGTEFHEGGLFVNGKRTLELPDEVLDVAPEYLIPEETHCILLHTDYDTLALRAIRGQLPRNLVELLLTYGDTKSKLGTWGVDFMSNVRADGRVRFEFHQAIASTGRLSASPNSMAVPRDHRYRDCFRAGKGKKLCIADYSQQEPRTSAAVANDAVYKKNYETGGDLYVTVAEEMLGRKVDKKTPEGAKDRQAVKAVVLGMAYRMGAGKLRDSLDLALNEKALQDGSKFETVSFDYAAELHKLFLEKCSGIKLFQELCTSLADPSSPAARKIWDEMLDAPVTFIESPCGRKRFFPPDATGLYTEPCNHPIQGCGATMTKAAMVLITREFAKRGWQDRAYLVNAIHDELVVEADEEIAVEAAQIMKRCMEQAGAYYVPDVKIIASFPTEDGTADRWMKD